MKSDVETPDNFEEYRVELEDVFLIIDAIQDKLSEHRLKNLKTITMLASFKLGIRIMPEDFAMKLFNNLFTGLNAIYQLAGFKKLSKDKDFGGAKDFFRNTVIEEIKSGKLFKFDF